MCCFLSANNVETSHEWRGLVGSFVECEEPGVVGNFDMILGRAVGTCEPDPECHYILLFDREREITRDGLASITLPSNRVDWGSTIPLARGLGRGAISFAEVAGSIQMH